MTTAAGLFSTMCLATACAYPIPNGDFSVSGTVSGTTGEGIVISDDSGTSVFVASDGKFVLDNAFLDGDAYEIRVERGLSERPIKCTVTNGSGVIKQANVDDVAVVCAPSTFTVSGTVSGLDTYGLVLTSRGEEIALAKDGRFVFFAPVPSGSSYSVKVDREPEGETCTVDRGSGVVGAADVEDVVVKCAPRDS